MDSLTHTQNPDHGGTLLIPGTEIKLSGKRNRQGSPRSSMEKYIKTPTKWRSTGVRILIIAMIHCLFFGAVLIHTINLPEENRALVEPFPGFNKSLKRMGIGRAFASRLDARTNQIKLWGSIKSHYDSNKNTISTRDELDMEDPQQFLTISAGVGTNVACGILRDTMRPKCFGNSSLAKIEPPAVPMYKIAVGRVHACGVTADLSLLEVTNEGIYLKDSKDENKFYESIDVICWGVRTKYPKETKGNIDYLSPPTHIADKLKNDPVVDVSCGADYTCLRTRSGQATCRGVFIYNDKVQNAYDFMPRKNQYESLSAGNGVVCGINQKTHKAHCWGLDCTKRRICFPPDNIEFSHMQSGALAVTDSFACGLTKNLHMQSAGSRLVCWGNLDEAKTRIPFEDEFAMIEAGPHTMCGIRSQDLAMRCWGSCLHGICDGVN